MFLESFPLAFPLLATCLPSFLGHWLNDGDQWALELWYI